MPATYTENGNTPNGTQVVFTYTFPALQPEDVQVALNGITQAITKYSVDNTSSPTKITFNNTSIDSTVQEASSGAPKEGVTVRVFRETKVGNTTGNHNPKATFAAGSSVRASDLNDNQKQALYSIQELQEQGDVYSFDSRYRVSSSDPTIDNDEGDLVYNTTDDLLKVFTGSQFIRTTPTATQLTNIGIVAEEVGLGTDMGDVDGALDTVGDGVINTVATNINNINRYANEYKIANSAPSNPQQGHLWYDTASSKLKVYNSASSQWIEVTTGQNTFSINQTGKVTDSIVYYNGSEFKADNTTTKNSLVKGGNF
tara:strand:- start:249 stop:1187 length:939 start_codon:yes stop_codon:yes gene_type:complete